MLPRRLTLVGCFLVLALGAGWHVHLVGSATAAGDLVAVAEPREPHPLPPWMRAPHEQIERLARVHDAQHRASAILGDTAVRAGAKERTDTFEVWWSLAQERASRQSWEAAKRLAHQAADHADTPGDLAVTLRLVAWSAVHLRDATAATEALAALRGIEPLPDVPVLDALLCARVFSLAEDHATARHCSTRVSALGGHHAIALEIEMELVRNRLRTAPDAEAIRDARRLQQRFSEYPEPDGFALDLAHALEQTGALNEAATVLEERLYEAPWRQRAGDLEEALVALVAQGALRPRRSLQERLAQGQAVRFARHWPLAERLLSGVHADALASGASADFVGRVQFQRMLNAYEDQRFHEAELLAQERIASGFAGSPPRLVLLTYLRAISRQEGRIEEAWLHTQRLGERYPLYLTAAHVEEMAFDLGFFADALQIARARRSGAWMRGFSGIFLRYLAGDPESAADFEGLAGRVRGEASDRARYWAARAYARNGDRARAQALFEALRVADRGRAVPANFYRMAAAWRLQDLEQERAPAEPTPELEPPGEPALPMVQATRAAGVDDTPDLSAAAHHAGSESPGPKALEPTPPTRLSTTRNIAPGERPAWGEIALGHSRPATVHWGGRENPVPADFVHTAEDHAAHLARPLLSRPERIARLQTFADAWGDDFPDAKLTLALLSMGLDEEARRIFRHILIEERQLRAAGQRTRLPLRSPLVLPAQMHAHLIDHRRSARGWWGVRLTSARFPVPADPADRAVLATRQTRLLQSRESLREDLMEAAVALEDAHFLRRFALAHSTFPDRNLHVHGRAYAQSMIDHTRHQNLSPWLMWALMIVESDFNPDSVSVADAYGLLQVIPRTGELMALRLEEPDFGIHQLLEPTESIRYGTAYLRAVLDKFHGQEVLALVGYNAGPHQVARWLDWRGDLLAADEWLETLPFASARAYAHNIVRLMTAYSHAHGLDTEVYVGNQLRADYLDNIYF